MKRRDFLKKAGGVATVAAVPAVLSAKGKYHDYDLITESHTTPTTFNPGPTDDLNAMIYKIDPFDTPFKKGQKIKFVSEALLPLKND